MKAETTRAARSSKQIEAVRVRESILGDPALPPLVPDERPESPALALFAAEWMADHGGSTGEIE